MLNSSTRCICAIKGAPVVEDRIITSGVIRKAESIGTTPYEHLFAGPNSAMLPSRSRPTVGCNDRPAIYRRIVNCAVIGEKRIATDRSAPNQHLTSCPDRGVIQPRGRRTIGRYSSEDLRRSVVTIPGARETVWCNTTQTSISVPVHTAECARRNGENPGP